MSEATTHSLLLVWCVHLAAVATVVWGRNWYGITLDSLGSPSNDTITVRWTNLSVHHPNNSADTVEMTLGYIREERTLFSDGSMSRSQYTSLRALTRPEILHGEYNITGDVVSDTWYSVCITWRHGPVSSTDCLTIKTTGDGDVFRRHGRGGLYRRQVVNVTRHSAEVDVWYERAAFTLKDVNVTLRDDNERHLLGRRSDMSESRVSDIVHYRYTFLGLNATEKYDVCYRPKVVYANAADGGSEDIVRHDMECHHDVIRTYDRRGSVTKGYFSAATSLPRHYSLAITLVATLCLIYM